MPADSRLISQVNLRFPLSQGRWQLGRVVDMGVVHACALTPKHTPKPVSHVTDLLVSISEVGVIAGALHVVGRLCFIWH